MPHRNTLTKNMVALQWIETTVLKLSSQVFELSHNMQNCIIMQNHEQLIDLPQRTKIHPTTHLPHISQICTKHTQPERHKPALHRTQHNIQIYPHLESIHNSHLSHNAQTQITIFRQQSQLRYSQNNAQNPITPHSCPYNVQVDLIVPQIA